MYYGSSSQKCQESKASREKLGQPSDTQWATGKLGKVNSPDICLEKYI